MPGKKPVLVLDQFVPYRLNQLASQVSERLSEVYRDRFGLEVPEWRLLVTLGPDHVTNAGFLAESTRMVKSRVSRAMSSLVERGLIERVENQDDRREAVLQLTTAGRKLYNELVPLALAREESLLATMSSGDRTAFLRGLAALEQALAANPAN